MTLRTLARLRTAPSLMVLSTLGIISTTPVTANAADLYVHERYSHYYSDPDPYDYYERIRPLDRLPSGYWQRSLPYTQHTYHESYYGSYSRPQYYSRGYSYYYPHPDHCYRWSRW